jgi:hypothetical protein
LAARRAERTFEVDIDVEALRRVDVDPAAAGERPSPGSAVGQLEADAAGRLRPQRAVDQHAAAQAGVDALDQSPRFELMQFEPRRSTCCLPVRSIRPRRWRSRRRELSRALLMVASLGVNWPSKSSRAWACLGARGWQSTKIVSAACRPRPLPSTRSACRAPCRLCRIDVGQHGVRLPAVVGEAKAKSPLAVNPAAAGRRCGRTSAAFGQQFDPSGGAAHRNAAGVDQAGRAVDMDRLPATLVHRLVGFSSP